MYIIASESISTVYFTHLSHHSVCSYVILLSLLDNGPVRCFRWNEYKCNNRRMVGRDFFYAVSVVLKESRILILTRTSCIIYYQTFFPSVGTGGSFLGAKCDHSPPSNAEVKKVWIYTSIPPYAFMARCRDNFMQQTRTVGLVITYGVDGRGYDRIGMLPRHLSERTEENHEERQDSRSMGRNLNPARPPTPNKKQECYPLQHDAWFLTKNYITTSRGLVSSSRDNIYN
jgi:hypothetical protein